MKTSMTKYVAAIGLAGVLVLAATAALAQNGLGGSNSYPSQYCVPQDENSGLRSIYC